MKKSLLIIFFCCVIKCDVCVAQAGEWTWMKGDSGINIEAVYGIQGIPNVNNHPRSLYLPTHWTDKQGNFWLFGGTRESGGGGHEYNTLWKFDPLTNYWTWMKGDTTYGVQGTYGTQGIPDTNNTPGGRYSSAGWVDTAGHLWLYGGDGRDAICGSVLSDLWMYHIASNTWTWINGPDNSTVAPVYGIKGTPAMNNTPGARLFADAFWVDDSNCLWLFGGAIYSGALCFKSIMGMGNDMWKWDPNINQWTWMQGTNVLSGSGVYGIKGVADSSNYPAGRAANCSWTDSDGNFYFFGGYYFWPGNYHTWNDLWKYDWHTNEFTWVSGPSTTGGSGMYGVQGIPDTSNIPSSRFECSYWEDRCNNFWLYGGLQEESNADMYNDLWMYQPTSSEWTWVSGESISNFDGNYGTQGVPSSSNEPPAKFGSVGWIDSAGSLWMYGGVTVQFGLQNDLWKYVPDSSICIQQQPSLINFAAVDSAICEKFCINFIDSSQNNPTAWQWFFPGGDPSSSTNQNPTDICYNLPGVYDVTLITTNANGNDTLTLLNYITVSPTPPFPVITQIGYTLTSSPSTSYQWQLNSADIPGATNQSYDVLQSGFYTVIVGDSNGCVNSSTTYVLISGIDEVNDAGISIYPNPSSGSFTIEVLNKMIHEEISIDLINTLGQKVFSASEKISSHDFKKEIDLTQFADGVYYITLQSKNLSLKKKIVIGH